MMRKWLLVGIMASLAIVSNAQFRKIPAEVTDSFKVKYSSASGVSWKDKLSSFQADFKLADKQVKAVFSSKGEWQKSETKYAYTDVPAEVKDGFKKSKYASQAVIETILLEEKGKGPQYKIITKKNDYNKKVLLFSGEGQLLSDNTSF